jgi:hypothetical protein
MNEQEMQFADPDWQPVGQTPLAEEETITSGPLVRSVTNARSALTQDVNETVYEQGYRRQTYQRELVSPAPQMVSGAARRTISLRALWSIWALAFLLLFLLVGSVFSHMSRYDAYHHHHHGHASFGAPVQGLLGQNLNTYALAGASQIVVVNPVGSITIQVASATTNTLGVQNDGFQINVAYAGNSLLLAPAPGDSQGNMLITVPQNIGLNLKTAQGNIQVDGFNGQVVAQTYSGAITLNSANLVGQSLLSSYSGTIQMQQGSLSDVATLSDYVGSLFLNQEKLSGRLAFRTGATGGIRFQGLLDPLGSYEFVTNDGPIDLTLPASTALQIQQVDVLGTYQSDFAASTGNAPQAEVMLSSRSGAVTIHKQP